MSESQESGAARTDAPANAPAASVAATTRGSKENLSGSKTNLGSRGNLMGSKADLSGSKGNLAGSRAGSIKNLASKSSTVGQNAAGGGGGGGGGGTQDPSAPSNAVVFENTYKLKPDKKFQSGAVKRIIEATLAKHLTKVKYDYEKAPELVKTISNEILAAVKKLEFDRYKIIVDVNMGEFKGQGIKVASRAVWDTTTDSYSSASFKNVSGIFQSIEQVSVEETAMTALAAARKGAQQLREFLLRANGNVMVLTGAGVSTESGIPDYRGPNGVYVRNKDYKPIQYQQFIGPHSFRQRYWARSFLGWPRISSAQVNRSHVALAALESGKAISGLITQNVDEDFQNQLAAMNPAVYEWSRLNPDRIDPDVSSSVNPDGDVELTWDYAQFQYPHCPKCAGMLKPNVVFFGENMPERVREASFKMVDDADALLIIGSSLTVYSALRLAKRAADAAKPVAILNLGETRGDAIVKLRIEQESSPVLEELAAIIR
eukprot:jgi/Hompol1/6014/HPOL_004809-RA